MAPFPQIDSRSTAADGSGSNPLSPTDIAGLASAAAVILGLCLWLGAFAYRRSIKRRIKGASLEGNDKAIPLPRAAVKVQPRVPGYFSRDQLTASIVLPNQNIIRPDATKDEILQHHIAHGTMTRPFSIASSYTLDPLSPPKSPKSPRSTTALPIAPGSFLGAAARSPSPRRASFFSFGNRPTSVASSTVSTILGVDGRKVRQLFSPVLPDELVVSLEERVTVVKSFDDGWCVVGRDSITMPGGVEMGVVPAWCFVKPVKGLKVSRPMRTTSLGITVEAGAGPGFSSREEVISWSNFS